SYPADFRQVALEVLGIAESATPDVLVEWLATLPYGGNARVGANALSILARSTLSAELQDQLAEASCWPDRQGKAWPLRELIVDDDKPRTRLFRSAKVLTADAILLRLAHNL